MARKLGWKCSQCDRLDYSPSFDRYCCTVHYEIAPFHPCGDPTCEFCSLPQTDEGVLEDARIAQERHR